MSETFALVLETSTPKASISTIEPDGRMTHREFTSDRSHNAVLFSPLKELLDAREATEIGLVLVGSGPGSYSGTRVGIAAAQGVAIACGCPAVALPSILAVPSARDGARCLAIGDARRGSFWTAEIDGLRLVSGPELTDADGLQEIVRNAIAGKVAIFSIEDPARFPLPDEIRDRIRLESPDSNGLWGAWCAASTGTRETWSAVAPQPIYLKPPHITPAKRSWLMPS
jgi:tRNA threonylcarbamoyladenosine biosynthesis protein TsaB